jgi:hypothetical protein
MPRIKITSPSGKPVQNMRCPDNGGRKTANHYHTKMYLQPAYMVDWTRPHK